MKKNIIVLMLDTARASDVYGNTALHTIGALAKNGTAYLNTVAPGTWTAPTHASLFVDSKVSEIKQVSQNFFKSGKSEIDPWMVRTKFLDGQRKTIANKLSAHGYYSVLLSNNPFLTSNTNLAMGFDKVYDIWRHSNVKYNKGLSDKVSFILSGGASTRSKMYKVSHAVSRLMPRPILDKTYLSLRKKMGRSVAKADGTYRLDRGANDTNETLSRYLKYSYNYSPQFMFINYIEAHENYPLTKRDTVQDKWLYLGGIEEMGDDTKIALHKAYLRRLTYLDGKVGEAIAMLKKGGMLDNATIVVTSDHGQLFGEHDGLYHAMPPYEGVTKVPLIAANYADGKQIREKDHVETPISLLSLHQAILNVASGRYDHLNGNLRRQRYVISEHTGISEGWDEELLAMLKPRSVMARKIYAAKKRFNRRATAVYCGRYKLIHFFGNRMDELYDVDADPQETNNILGANRDVANRMYRMGTPN